MISPVFYMVARLSFLVGLFIEPDTSESFLAGVQEEFIGAGAVRIQL